MPKQLEYEEKYRKITKVLEKEKSIVLCTSNGEKVAARTVYFIFCDDCIYFVTSRAYPKYKQIVKNSNVALYLINLIEKSAYRVG